MLRRLLPPPLQLPVQVRRIDGESAGQQALGCTVIDVIQFPEPRELPDARETIYVRATRWRRYRHVPPTGASELTGGRG